MMNIRFNAIRYLSNLSEGETGEIVQVRGKPDFHRYLFGQGLMMGSKVCVNHTDSHTADTSLTVRAGNYIAVIDKALAHNIKVRIS